MLALTSTSRHLTTFFLGVSIVFLSFLILYLSYSSLRKAGGFGRPPRNARNGRPGKSAGPKVGFVAARYGRRFRISSHLLSIRYLVLLPFKSGPDAGSADPTHRSARTVRPLPVDNPTSSSRPDSVINYRALLTGRDLNRASAAEAPFRFLSARPSPASARSPSARWIRPTCRFAPTAFPTDSEP